jgi:hypothetical protein
MAVLIIDVPYLNKDGDIRVKQIAVRGIIDYTTIDVDLRERDEPLNVWTPIVLTGGSVQWQP